MKKLTLIIVILLSFLAGLVSYKYVSPFIKPLLKKSIVWDSANIGNYKEFLLVNIISSVDSNIQKAYFLKSDSTEAQPLIVSLHTWSGGYDQYDPLSDFVKDNGWNYIHPDFRGANNKPEACLSNKVITDIDDAIIYAKKHSNVSKVIIVGVSGGASAAIAHYMKGKEMVDEYSAWVPISDLNRWYFESTNKMNIYAKDLLNCVSDKNNSDDKMLELKARSPLLMEKTNDNKKINIYAGINDGYDGSVSIINSLLFYNKISSNKISSDVIQNLLSRNIMKNGKFLDDRAIYYKNSDQFSSITIFDGSHEMLINYVVKNLK